jgi:predicted alpha-1,2-mannosidase
MKKIMIFCGRVVKGVYALVMVAALQACSHNTDDPLSYVDPRIGGVELLLQPTRPTAQVPNQMIRSYPVREDQLDDQVKFFPLTLISHRNGELFGIMPFTGELSSKPPVSAWDANLEILKPGYYSTWLEDYGITAEFTPGKRSGIFRLTFPAGKEKGIFLANVRNGSWKRTGPNRYTGTDAFSGMRAWSVLETDCVSELSDTVVSGALRQIIRLPAAESEKVEIRYAISFISAEQAEKSLEEEAGKTTFEKLNSLADSEWERVLGKIKVKGGTEKQKKVFYTALYRCFERMINISEDGRYYSNYDSTVHESSRNFYVDDWSWDTYLALHPLRSILDPGLEADMMQSYVEMYKQSGWMPTFPVLYGDSPCMNGFHSTIILVDEYMKGIRNFDVATAYEGMKKNSMTATMLPWVNGPSCRLDDFYRKNGFYPALRPGEKETVPQVHSWEKRQSVSVTLGHSYDDWALSQLARELGKTDDFALFSKRAQNYRSLWWPEKGFFMPKDEQGRWIDIDPKWDGGMGGRDYYDENNGWTYLWQVQHDIPGLIGLMGGKKKFEERLDQLFREDLGRSKYENWAKFPDFSGIVGEYSMGNEPSFHIPYLYNFTDSPWKTQKRVRMLLDTWFRDDIFGIPGDEDGGGMSAFVVFSMMGFYPVTPAIPVYTISSPVFSEVKITLPDNRVFTIRADKASTVNIYVNDFHINGKKAETPFFSHDDITAGSTLVFVMGAYPAKDRQTVRD